MKDKNKGFTPHHDAGMGSARPPYESRDGAGFTLIEILIVLVILVVLLVIGYPNYVKFKEKQKARTTADIVLNSLFYAKQKATETELYWTFEIIEPEKIVIKKGNADNWINAEIIKGEPLFAPIDAPVNIIVFKQNGRCIFPGYPSSPLIIKSHYMQETVDIIRIDNNGIPILLF